MKTAVDVGQLLAEARLTRDTQTLCLHPITELGHEGRAAGRTLEQFEGSAPGALAQSDDGEYENQIRRLSL
ncbi:hypothetical protein PXK20_20720 [Phaeobacter gallaeciensis]|nr:hypothetical protein [Phaeobacter gallaeciensis]